MARETLTELRKRLDLALDSARAQLGKTGPALVEAEAHDAARTADALVDDAFLREQHRCLLYARAAVMYRVLADEAPDSSKKFSQYASAGNFYHFAAHGYRSLEDYRRAGSAYSSSGVCYASAAEHAPDAGARLKMLNDAVRSHRRAKGVWSEVGDYDVAGDSYYEEQKAREQLLFETNPAAGVAFFLWGRLIGHGERFTHWLGAAVAGTLLFAFAIWAYGTPRAPFSHALLVSVQRTLLMSSAQNVAGLSPWIEVAQTLFSYFMLGIGVALIVRRLGPR